MTLPDAVPAAEALARVRAAAGETARARCASSTCTPASRWGRAALAGAGAVLPRARAHAHRRGRRAAARADRRGARARSAVSCVASQSTSQQQRAAGGAARDRRRRDRLRRRARRVPAVAPPGLRAGRGDRPLGARHGRCSDLYPRYRVPLAIEQLELERLDERRRRGRRLPARRRRADRRGAARARRARRRPQRRLPPAARWRPTSTGTASTRAPSCSSEAVYGLTELHREQIAGAGIVANPGCYPTASLLALAPLARAGLIADVVIDAKQGISGAGRVFDETTHLSIAGENIVPYKVAAHRHTPEIEEQLRAARPRPSRAEGAVPGAPRAARPGRAGQLLRDDRRAR